jgi:hydrogenase maturation protease
VTTAPIVLGIGNILLTDDGVGVHAVRALAEDAGLPPGTEVVDGGTGGLSLLPIVRDATALVLVDAVDVGAPPGSVHVLTGADLYAGLVRLSVHQVGAADLLAAARLTGGLPADVVLVGVQPASLAPDVRLSAPVAAALPAVLAAVREWCHRLCGAQRVGGR